MKRRKKNIPKIFLLIIAVIINVVLIIMVLASISDALKEREENIQNGVKIETNSNEQETIDSPEQDVQEESEEDEMSIKDKLQDLF